MTITRQGTTADGRSIVFWDDGSWSYQDTLGLQTSPDGQTHSPTWQGYDVVHFFDDPATPKPGTNPQQPAYTIASSSGGGGKQFLPPSSFGAAYPSNDGGPFSRDTQWNPQSGQYEDKIPWASYIGAGTGAAIGGLAAGAAFGGGGAAGTLPSQAVGAGYVPGIEGGTGLAGVDLGAATGAALPSGAGAAAGTAATQAALDSNPAFDAAGNFVGEATNNQPGFGSGAWGKLGSLLTGPLGKVLAAGIPAAIGLATRPNGSNGTGPTGLPPSPAMPPELQQLLQMAVQRATYQNPLFQAVTGQAFAGLPTYAKQGIPPPGGSR